MTFNKVKRKIKGLNTIFKQMRSQIIPDKAAEECS